MTARPARPPTVVAYWVDTVGVVRSPSMQSGGDANTVNEPR